jgi:hypothetical protein
MNCFFYTAVLLVSIDNHPVEWRYREWIGLSANLALAIVGTVGIIVAVRTLKAIRRQADIANKALIAQFRPRLHVRRMRVLETDNSLSLDVILVNRGDMVGRVVNTSIKTTWVLENSRG